MSVTYDGIYIDGQKATFHPEDILTGDASAYTEEIGTAVNAWMEENVTGGEQVTDTTLTLSGVPADAKVTGDEIAGLKEDLNYISSVNTTWYDGYISSEDGSLKPPTADAQKSSDFIDVLEGSKIKAVVSLNTAHYRNVSIVGYDTEKGFISVLNHVEGSSLSNYAIDTTISNSNVKYVRIMFNGYNDIASVNVYKYVAIDEVSKQIDSKIASVNASIDEIKDLDNIRFQYLDASTWESGYYNWNSAQTALIKNAGGENWFCLKSSEIPPGTYHYNKFCSLAFSFIENLSTGTFANLGDIGITETVNGTVTISYPFRLWLSLNKVYFDRTTTMFASGNLPSSYVYGLYKDESASYYVNAQGQKIWIVGNGYISTIQGACDMASANDIIFIRCGTYTEQVSIWNKKLHLIGENKANTILIDHSGAYNTPPLEMSLGSLSNMTIIEDGTQPTLQPGESGYNGAYCLHIEWTPPAGEVFRIDNCDFINYIHSPLGCGLYQDYTVHFTNCRFICLAENEGNNERGSFYFHSNINPSVTGQKIIAENCIISSAGQKWAVLLGVPSGANNSGSAEARFSGCTIWNENLGTVDSIAYFDTSGGADVLKVVHSCGNTVDVLNNW